MPTKQPPTDLAKRIQNLLDERQQHADAIVRIEAILERVGAALSPGVQESAGNADKSANGESATLKAPVRKRRGRGGFSTTAEETILAFVKQHRNPTNREIETSWKKEGRGSSAANTLSKLVKEKKLKREPLEGQRGSRYSLA